MWGVGDGRPEDAYLRVKTEVLGHLAGLWLRLRRSSTVLRLLPLLLGVRRRRRFLRLRGRLRSWSTGRSVRVLLLRLVRRLRLHRSARHVQRHVRLDLSNHRGGSRTVRVCTPPEPHGGRCQHRDAYLRVRPEDDGWYDVRSGRTVRVPATQPPVPVHGPGSIAPVAARRRCAAGGPARPCTAPPPAPSGGAGGCPTPGSRQQQRAPPARPPAARAWTSPAPSCPAATSSARSPTTPAPPAAARPAPSRSPSPAAAPTQECRETGGRHGTRGMQGTHRRE